MTNHIIDTFFGPAVLVFEITHIFKHKETGKYRIPDSNCWCWAKTLEEAVEFMRRPYNSSNIDNNYLETVSVSATPIHLVEQPNPANIADMDKGKPFEFKRDEPGILLNKWGY